jgi:hypothetical protein
MIEFHFVEQSYQDYLSCRLYIPKKYDGALTVSGDTRKGSLPFPIAAPPWFSSLLNQAREMYQEKNKIRALFQTRKDIETILIETLLFEEGKKVVEYFQQNGKIMTTDTGIYEDLKEALLREGYEFNTSFQLGYYTFTIS